MMQFDSSGRMNSTDVTKQEIFKIYIIDLFCLLGFIAIVFILKVKTK